MAIGGARLAKGVADRVPLLGEAAVLVPVGQERPTRLLPRLREGAALAATGERGLDDLRRAVLQRELLASEEAEEDIVGGLVLGVALETRPLDPRQQYLETRLERRLKMPRLKVRGRRSEMSEVRGDGLVRYRFRGRRPAPPKLPTVAWINDPSREALIQNN